MKWSSGHSPAVFASAETNNHPIAKSPDGLTLAVRPAEDCPAVVWVAQAASWFPPSLAEPGLHAGCCLPSADGTPRQLYLPPRAAGVPAPGVRDWYASFRVPGKRLSP